MVMRRIIGVSMALALAAALLVLFPTSKHGVPVVYAQSGCSLATLSGNYAFVYTGDGAPGHSVRAQNIIPGAAVGVFTFDGTGDATASYTVVFNGQTSGTSVPDSGTYTLNSDCTGTLTDTTIGIHFNIATASGGAEIFGIQTDPGNTDTFDAKKQ
jgi:hypothetical protein